MTLNTVEMQVDTAETDLTNNETNVLAVTTSTITDNGTDIVALQDMVAVQKITADFGYENAADVEFVAAET